jgi:GT2 family glycosyltransferase
LSKELGIVICNFNKVDYLKGCLETLYKSNFGNLTYDVIVVDNASIDGSPKFIRENYPQIILLENEINTGGSGGFDRGIKYSLEKEYQYTVLLDNDILLEENTLINLIEYIKNNSNVGIVGSKICRMDNPTILQEMGSFIDFERNFNIKTPYKGYKDTDDLPEVVNCDYVPACCLVTTIEVLQKVGSFNTDHFIYWDDMDWCTRVKRAGWEVHAINSSRVFHKMGVANYSNTFGVYYFERNRIMFFLKYLKGNKVDEFINKTCDWLITMTFFSNLKGSYSIPSSLLLSIDDLLLNNLGKQDKSILVKEEEKTVFKKYNLNFDDKIAIYALPDIKSTRTIVDYLESYYNNIEIICDEDNYLWMKRNFSQTIIGMKLFNTNKYKNIFYCLEHILDYKKQIDKIDKIIYIDRYLNNCSSTEIDDLLKSYDSYKNIFNNVFVPLFQRKFYTIAKSL